MEEEEFTPDFWASEKSLELLNRVLRHYGRCVQTPTPADLEAMIKVMAILWGKVSHQLTIAAMNGDQFEPDYLDALEKAVVEMESLRTDQT
jgi:hypothetical protein